MGRKHTCSFSLERLAWRLKYGIHSLYGRAGQQAIPKELSNRQDCWYGQSKVVIMNGNSILKSDDDDDDDDDD